MTPERMAAWRRRDGVPPDAHRFVQRHGSRDIHGWTWTRGGYRLKRADAPFWWDSTDPMMESR